MKTISCLKTAAVLLMTIQILGSCDEDKKINAPHAEKIKKELKIHGDTRIDNYYWMNDIDNPKVTKYLEEENNYTSQSLKHTEKLQTKLFDEITSRIQAREKSVPFKDNGYFYYQRYEPQEEQPLYCRKIDNPKGKEEIMLDLTQLSLGYPFYDIEDYSISPNNKYISYSVDTLGRRRFEIRFKNIITGEELADKIPDCSGAPIWADDNKTIFYIKKDPETLRDYKICKHIMGEDIAKDVDVFIEKDDTFDVDISRSKSDKYIFIQSYSTISTEFRYILAEKPDDNFKIIQKRQKNLEYFVEHKDDKFYILNNNNAENFKLSVTQIETPEKKYWKDAVPESGDVFIEDFDIFQNYIVLNERIAGQLKFHVIKFLDNSDYYIDFGEEVYEAWLSDNYDCKTDSLRYGYSSLTTPTSYFDIDLNSKQKQLLKQKYVGEDFDSKNYESKRLFATAEDGTYIPISLVYKKGIILDSNNPLLIYGYGAYGISSDAYFIPSMLSILDRGFVYAIAHVRGGQDLGRQWYDGGKLFNKKNSFTDFVTCTKYLQDKKYSKPELTFAQGASAGGLLVAEIANSAPELYAGIIAEVPFVDVVTTMLDKTIPLTTSEYDEWGNPENKKYYQYMLSYSPYDQVKKQKYPAMLITSGLHDSQVQYWEPAKWAAKIREYNTGNNPIYLWINMDAGHGGASGRFEIYKETALTYAFMLDRIKQYRDNN
jgi:oligopeptidase B